MKIERSLLINLFSRVTKNNNPQKRMIFAERIECAPIILRILIPPFSFLLGRCRTLDRLLVKTPIVNLFAKFLIGNIRLIEKSEDVISAVISSDFKVSSLSPTAYDVIVIGSGPGGAIAALRSAQEGNRVLIVEAGESYTPGTIEHHSLTQTVKQFANKGMNFIWGIKPVLYAEGATLGGGSEVNSGLYHRIEGVHREGILKALEVSENEWTELEELVEKEISVQLEPNAKIPELGLVPGAKLNGLIVKEVPRWRKYEPVEKHQGMQATYLAKARQRNAEFLTGLSVTKIVPLPNKIEIHGLRNSREVILTSREVVLAAGTLETPRILNKSNLSSSGFTLNFHPMLRAVAKHDRKINDGNLFPSWQAWDEELKFKYGYSVSNFPYLAATLPSLGEMKNFSDADYSTMAAYFSSFELVDSKAYLIKFGKKLIPFVKWGKKDKRSMNASSKILAKCLNDGGATEVWPKKELSPVTTVHLFGSIPLGATDLIDGLGRLKSETRIRISDASLMPSAPWCNPQGAIMVLCELMAKRNNKL